MTMVRSQLVDPSVTRWSHCMTKCVRGADLLANACEDRKAWIEQRLQELAQIFAVGVGGFSVIHEMLEGAIIVGKLSPSGRLHRPAVP